MKNLPGMKTWNGYLLNKLDITDTTPRWMIVWDDDTIPVRRFIVHYNGYFIDNNNIAYQHANEDVWPMICEKTRMAELKRTDPELYSNLTPPQPQPW